MHVLYISPAAGLGGSERSLLDCIASLKRVAPHVSVAVLSFATGPLLPLARELGAQLEVVELPEGLASMGESGSGYLELISRPMRDGIALARFLARLSASISNVRADLVHTNGMKAHVLAGVAAPRQTPLVVHIRDFISARRASRHLLRTLGQLRQRTLFVANSKAVAADFRSLLPGARMRVLYNAIDTEHFNAGLSDPSWLAGLAQLSPPSPSALSFGLVATYAKWKGHELFIEAARLFRAARPFQAARFYIVGGPIYATGGSQVQHAELVQHIQRAGLSADFGLIPFQADIARVYRSLNVVVHASTEPEPFGRTIVEAMACGRAVIAARAGGAVELFQHGENALGFEPRNAHDLAEQMARLAQDSVLRSKLGERSQAWARKSFSLGRLGSELFEMYSGLVRPDALR